MAETPKAREWANGDDWNDNIDRDRYHSYEIFRWLKNKLSKRKRDIATHFLNTATYGFIEDMLRGTHPIFDSKRNGECFRIFKPFVDEEIWRGYRASEVCFAFGAYMINNIFNEAIKADGDKLITNIYRGIRGDCPNYIPKRWDHRLGYKQHENQQEAIRK